MEVTSVQKQTSSFGDTLEQQALGLAAALDGKERSEVGDEIEEHLKRQVQYGVEQYVNKYLNESLESSLESINGVVRSSLNVSTSGVKGELEALIPLYSNDKDFVFVQPGVVLNDEGRYNGRDFVHAGIGYRTQVDDLMYGINTFYDYDLDRGHRRASIGGELWHDAYSLYTNYYFPLSSWAASPDTFSSLDDMSLEERPAYGADVGVSGYLPSYPWLSASLTYEQQFGDYVENEKGEDPTSNPYQIETSLDYNPIPMVSFGVSHRYDSATGSDYSANLGLKYIFGESLSKQLDPAYVKVTKSHDYQQKTSFVQRNHDIALEYRKTPFSIELVGSGEVTISSGASRNTAEFVQLPNSSDIKQLSYAGSAVPFIVGLSASQSALKSNGSVPVQPVSEFNHDIEYASGATDDFYELTYVATLKDGRTYQTRPLRVIFEHLGGDFGPENAFSKYEVITNNALADGSAANEVRVTLKDGSDNAVAGESFSFTVSGSAQAASPVTVTTDVNGQASFMLTNTVAEAVTVTSMHESGSRDVTVTFTADSSSADINNANSSFVVVSDGAVASGSAKNAVAVELKDANGNAVAGESITFSMTGSALATSPLTGVTDPNGRVGFTLTNTLAESVTVTATHSSGSRDVTVTFAADFGSVDINNVNSSFVVSSDNAVADGVATNEVVVTLKDANNNAVAGDSVSFVVTGSAQAASPTTVTTDPSGEARFTLTDTLAESVTVTATHRSGSRDVNVTFIADSGSTNINN
ncbi:TPA: hypothetical protein I7784_22000, partial [Vibrio vulnificus]|nr:hypothetical protein [Vibrio vulnificus]